MYDLADYRGKTIVINFWASWCPPCRAELPELIEFYNDNESDDDIVFLSVNLFETEQSPEELPKFIEDEMLPYPVIPDRAGAISAMYDVQSIPVTVVVNARRFDRQDKKRGGNGRMAESRCPVSSPAQATGIPCSHGTPV